ncbi:MAG: hypothetical protein K2Q97_06890, partial [Burkholderiaceae bacterium]|nr:hypothetical protein [Burkholderiaceae bacterium]
GIAPAGAATAVQTTLKYVDLKTPHEPARTTHSPPIARVACVTRLPTCFLLILYCPAFWSFP